MNDETLIEVIKALAFSEDVEDIANMAEVEVDEIESIAKKYKSDIEDRKKVTI